MMESLVGDRERFRCLTDSQGTARRPMGVQVWSSEESLAWREICDFSADR